MGLKYGEGQAKESRDKVGQKRERQGDNRAETWMAEAGTGWGP